MNRDLYAKAIKQATPEELADALALMLEAHASPVFGAAKAVEHEVAALRAMQRPGAISSDPDEYELVMSLRITRAKARALLYQAALRSRLSQADINSSLRQLLSAPRVCKEGDKALIEVADPFLMDCLRQKVRQLGFISDGSFSGSLAKVSVPALAGLINALLSSEQKTNAQKMLRRRGVRGDDLASRIVSIIGGLSRHAAGAAGEKFSIILGDKIADFFADGTNITFGWVQDHLPETQG